MTPAPWKLLYVIRQIKLGNSNIPIASVLADPAAWRQRKTIRSQYADVGTSANPTHESERSNRQAAAIGRRPRVSDKVPQNIGAISVALSKLKCANCDVGLTRSLKYHIDCHLGGVVNGTGRSRGQFPYR